MVPLPIVCEVYGQLHRSFPTQPMLTEMQLERLTIKVIRAKKYKAAVFLSGSRNLAEETAALLRHNKRRITELEVQRERKRRKSMAR